MPEDKSAYKSWRTGNEKRTCAYCLRTLTESLMCPTRIRYENHDYDICDRCYGQEQRGKRMIPRKVEKTLDNI